MLFPGLLKSALEDSCSELVKFEQQSGSQALEYARLLQQLPRDRDWHTAGGAVQHSSDEIGRSAPGAVPSDELQQTGSVIHSFNRQWKSHEDARRWAYEVLLDRVTFAADGSQLLPGRDISLPVAGVQVAWFENPHSRDGAYTKQAKFEVVPPAELFDEEGQVNPETIVAAHRTKLEIEKLCDFLRSRQGWRERGERMPLAFFDGSLTYLAMFQMPKSRIQNKYASSVLELTQLSEEAQVPIVGYVDHSYARELIKLLDTVEGRGSSIRRYPYNAQILRASADDQEPLLAQWGDRTILFSFVEPGADVTTQPLFGFCYLQTTSESLPARLDIPSWVYSAGFLDEVIDTVRAECVVGVGYPYAIETADEAAVITVRDRELFYQALQDLARTNNLRFRVSRKATSKSRRR
jgi:NurA domain